MLVNKERSSRRPCRAYNAVAMLLLQLTFPILLLINHFQSAISSWLPPRGPQKKGGRLFDYVHQVFGKHLSDKGLCAQWSSEKHLPITFSASLSLSVTSQRLSCMEVLLPVNSQERSKMCPKHLVLLFEKKSNPGRLCPHWMRKLCNG